MGTRLDDRPLVEVEDQVGVGHRREAVGNGDHGAADQGRF